VFDAVDAARIQARIAVSPTACAATRTPARWASSAMAANSASVLLGPGRGGMGHHSTGGRYLDQLGTVPYLVADTRDHIGHSVGNALGHRQRHDARCQPLEHRGVQVAAVQGDRVTGRPDPWPDVPALIDRALQRDVQQISRS
jgi:hypothetical protein